MNPTARKALVLGGVTLLGFLLLFWPGFGGETRHDVDSDIRDCTENLRALYQGLRELRDRDGVIPGGSGPGFGSVLFEAGLWTSGAQRERLHCPGGAPGSRYAGRDQRLHPLEAFPAGGPNNEPILACDGSGAPNHDGFHNVLYTDGTVATLDLGAEIEAGRLPAGTTHLVPGPDCALVELRKLTAKE